MSDVVIYEQALAKLRDVLPQLSASSELKQILESRDLVLSDYQKIFSIEHLPFLTEGEFRSFLLFDKNRHWKGLHRQGPKICANMAQLHKALIGLVDESGPIENRIDEAWDLVPGMGRAIITAILLVTYPTKYGVWNRISEDGLKVLELWPHFDRGESLGKRYMRINKILLSLAGDLLIDLWTLDALWWSLFEDKTSGEIDSEVAAEFPGFIFDEERHLQWFLVQNWDKLSLSREWNIYSEPGNDMAGCEYRCSVGRIDILARHRTESDWLVIELKRDQTSDITVGQVLRYIGCIKKEMAQPGEIVRGLVIAREADMSLLYALDTVQNVKLQLYEIQFNLRPAIG